MVAMSLTIERIETEMHFPESESEGRSPLRTFKLSHRQVKTPVNTMALSWLSPTEQRPNPENFVYCGLSINTDFVCRDASDDVVNYFD